MHGIGDDEYRRLVPGQWRHGVNLQHLEEVYCWQWRHSNG